MDALDKLRDAVSDLTPGGMARRAASNASPVAPLFVFCGLAGLVSVALSAFSDDARLQVAAFSLFALTLALGVVVYLFCLARRPDLLRSENYDLEIRKSKLNRTKEDVNGDDSSVAAASGQKAEKEKTP